MSISDYKKELISGAFGALLAATLALAVGIYNLNESFQLTLKKEKLYSLNSDISLLMKVQGELDNNLNLLLNDDYRIIAEAKEIEPFEFPITGKDKEEKDAAIKMNEYFKRMLGKQYEIVKFHLPSDKFVVGAWDRSGPVVSDIDFDLIQMLNDFYRKLERINKFIDNAGDLSLGLVLQQSTINGINTSVPKYNEMINEITQNKILILKNSVDKELSKLAKLRGEIVL